MDPLFGFGPKLPKLNLEVLNGMTYSEKNDLSQENAILEFLVNHWGTHGHL